MDKVPAGEQPTSVCALPLYHIFAFTVGMMLSMRTGGKLILIPNPRDLPAVLKELSKHTFHSFPAVNTLFNGLANHPDFNTVNWKNLKVSVGGGMAVQGAGRQALAGQDRLPDLRGLWPVGNLALGQLQPDHQHGVHRHHRRAASQHLHEAAGRRRQRSAAGPARRDRHQGPAGHGRLLAAPRRDRQGHDARRLLQDAATSACMDERGYFKIVDRKKDMVLVSGFNVYPNEVEDVVAQLDGVLECAVVGVADEKTGEAVKLVIVKKDPSLTEEKVREYCKANLTGYKQPKVIEFRTDLPKTPVGKILRRELRDKKCKSSLDEDASQSQSGFF